MPTPHRINVFDQFGNPSKNLDEREIAMCSPEQQAVLFPMLEAFSDSQAADEYCTQVEADRRKAETALAKADKVLEAVTPMWTAHMEWQVTVAKMPRPEPDPTVTKKINSATKVRDAARAHLDACTAAVIPAKQVRDQKRAIFADRLREWSRVDGAPKNVGDLVEERARVEQEQKMANINAGLDPNYVEHAASTVGNSHLDRFKSGQGRGGSANFGYHRNALRGALPMAPKVPSQR